MLNQVGKADAGANGDPALNVKNLFQLRQSGNVDERHLAGQHPGLHQHIGAAGNRHCPLLGHQRQGLFQGLRDAQR